MFYLSLDAIKKLNDYIKKQDEQIAKQKVFFSFFDTIQFILLFWVMVMNCNLLKIVYKFR